MRGWFAGGDCDCLLGTILISGTLMSKGSNWKLGVIAFK